MIALPEMAVSSKWFHLTLSARFKSQLMLLLQNIERVINRPIAKRFTSADLSEIRYGQSLIPLIKASTSLGVADNKCFAGRFVLCVGGQMQLYPAYRQIIEDAGGSFISFHGGAEASLLLLQKLLDDADMVICPIDCIRHEAFFITKNYCEYFCKPCVMLDKSRITTFYNGIQALKNLQ